MVFEKALLFFCPIALIISGIFIIFTHYHVRYIRNQIQSMEEKLKKQLFFTDYPKDNNQLTDYRKVIENQSDTDNTKNELNESQMKLNTSLSDTFVKDCVNQIIINISNPFYSVEQLSSDMCMDRSGLYKKLKKTTGVVPKQFIKKIRIGYALEQLEDTTISIDKVIELSGFKSHQHFIQSTKETDALYPTKLLNTKYDFFQ